MKEIAQLAGHFTEVVKLATHPFRGNILASSDIEGKICLWDSNFNRPLANLVHGESFNIPGVSFIEGGNALLTLGHDKLLKVWKVQNK